MQTTSAFFWDITQRRMAIPYRRFGASYRYYLQGSRNPRLLDIWRRGRQVFPKRRYGITPPRCITTQNYAILVHFILELINWFTFCVLFSKTGGYLRQWLDDWLISVIHSIINSLARAECDHSLPFSAAASIPLCCVLFPSTQLHQPVFHPSLLLVAIYFLVYLSALLFQNSYLKLLGGILFSSILCTRPNQRNLLVNGKLKKICEKAGIGLERNEEIPVTPVRIRGTLAEIRTMAGYK